MCTIPMSNKLYRRAPRGRAPAPLTAPAPHLVESLMMPSIVSLTATCTASRSLMALVLVMGVRGPSSDLRDLCFPPPLKKLLTDSSVANGVIEAGSGCDASGAKTLSERAFMLLSKLLPSVGRFAGGQGERSSVSYLSSSQSAARLPLEPSTLTVTFCRSGFKAVPPLISPADPPGLGLPAGSGGACELAGADSGTSCDSRTAWACDRLLCRSLICFSTCPRSSPCSESSVTALLPPLSAKLIDFSSANRDSLDKGARDEL